MSSDAEELSPKPNNVSKPVQNIPVKHVKKKEKPHAKKAAVKKDSDKSLVEKSTVNNTDAGQSVSKGAMTTASEGDMLQAASINSIEDKREKLRAKIEELQGTAFLFVNSYYKPELGKYGFFLVQINLYCYSFTVH
jgi:hypothetical protein